MLENELIERTQRVTELETLPEISALVKSLKHALLQTSLRLGEKQQVLDDVYKNMGILALLSSIHHCTVSGYA